MKKKWQPRNEEEAQANVAEHFLLGTVNRDSVSQSLWEKMVKGNLIMEDGTKTSLGRAIALAPKFAKRSLVRPRLVQRALSGQGFADQEFADQE